ncbi:MAG: archaellin/type IV pilin N-terminal domain-containing protein [Candidatus Bathyarchaeia archaeon]|jgi:flagellin-like protein
MKILRSRKALSPVVASIILIAVTVAVSIAVAAWMGALTFNFMATEQIKITNMQFYTNSTGNNMTITMQNTGTHPVTVIEVHVNNAALNLLAAQFTIPANTKMIANVTYTWKNGAQYEVEARTSKGSQFTYTATAPSS